MCQSADEHSNAASAKRQEALRQSGSAERVPHRDALSRQRRVSTRNPAMRADGRTPRLHAELTL